MNRKNLLFFPQVCTLFDVMISCSMYLLMCQVVSPAWMEGDLWTTHIIP